MSSSLIWSHTNYHIVQHDAHTDGEQIIKVREGHCPADVEVAAPRNTTRFVAARLPPPLPPRNNSTLTLTLTLTLTPSRSAALPVVRLPPNSWLGSSLTRGSVRFY